jgi:hypothetical protein
MGGKNEGGDHTEVEGEGEREDRSRNQGFSSIFCLIMEGSGAGSGSIPLPNGSSGRPKKIWIRNNAANRISYRLNGRQDGGRE